MDEDNLPQSAGQLHKRTTQAMRVGLPIQHTSILVQEEGIENPDTQSPALDGRNAPDAVLKQSLTRWFKAKLREGRRDQVSPLLAEAPVCKELFEDGAAEADAKNSSPLSSRGPTTIDGSSSLRRWPLILPEESVTLPESTSDGGGGGANRSCPAVNELTDAEAAEGLTASVKTILSHSKGLLSPSDRLMSPVTRLLDGSRKRSSLFTYSISKTRMLRLANTGSAASASTVAPLLSSPCSTAHPNAAMAQRRAPVKPPTSMSAAFQAPGLTASDEQTPNS
jgi:hypothetical protein